MDTTVIWALSMVGGLVVLGLIGLAVLAERPREAGPDDERLHAEAAELAVHAAAVQVEAGRAAAAAVQARAAVAAAEQARDAAWAEQVAAERSYEQAWHDALDGRRTPTPGPDDRERAVARAALSAYRRGDISVDELRRVWQPAGNWYPGQEERERAAERHRLEQGPGRTVAGRVRAGRSVAKRAADRPPVLRRALGHTSDKREPFLAELRSLRDRVLGRRDALRRHRGPPRCSARRGLGA